MSDEHYTIPTGAHYEDDGGNEGAVDAADDYPVEELIPNSVRNGLDPQTLSKPLDPAIYGYDIAQMRERPWAKPGADKSDYFNYGFEEESWRAYCAMQAQGIQSLRARADRFVADILASQAQGTSGNASGQGGFGAASHGSNYLGYTSHTSHSSNANPTYAPIAPREQSRFYKTQLCQSFLNGQCTRGSACNYAHGQSELRPFILADRRPDGVGHMGMNSVNAMGMGVGQPPVSIGVMPPPPISGIPALPHGMPVPSLTGMPPMPMAMPPPVPVPTPMPRVGGEGVLSAPPAAPAGGPKGSAGFRVLPAAKRDREKSPDNVTY